MATKQQTKTFWMDRSEAIGPLLFIASVTAGGGAVAGERWGAVAVACSMLLGASGFWYLLGPRRRRVVVSDGVITVHGFLLRKSAHVSEVSSVVHVTGVHEERVDSVRINLAGGKAITVPFVVWTDTAQALLDELRTCTTKAELRIGPRASEDLVASLPEPAAPPKLLAPPEPAALPHVELDLPPPPPAASAVFAIPTCGNCGKLLGPDEYGWGPGPHFWQMCSDCGEMDAHGMLTAD